jgi:tetratricopeptide (TPR) repeat protein
VCKGHGPLFLTAFFLCTCFPLYAQEETPLNAITAPPTTSEQISYFSLHVIPGITIPLGESASYFGYGGTIELTAEYRLPFFPNLYVTGGVGYDLAPWPIVGQSLSLPNARLGVGFQFQFAPWLSFRVNGSAGYYYGFLNDQSNLQGSGNPCLIGGAGMLFRVGSAFSLEAGGSYKYFGGTWSGVDIFVGTALHFIQTASKAAPVRQELPKGLSISNLQIDPVFSVLHKFYDDHAFGHVQLRNTLSMPITNLNVNLFIRKYMDTPRKCLDLKDLKPGETRTIDLTALFNDLVLDVTEETKVTAELSWTYSQDGVASSDAMSQSVRVYGRNSMTWDDNRKACAFVTAKDPAVLIFSNNINSFAKALMNRALNKSFQAALAIHEALRLFGMSYVANAISYADVSKNKSTVDYLKFPRQTFDYRSGDCSDLSILYCALLESMQIETAFITIPGHIFMAISLNVTPEEAKKTFTHTDDLIFREEKTWLPIEITERTGDFLTAWAEGAREWRENFGRQQADFYPIREGWKIYEAVQFPGSSAVEVPARDKFAGVFREEIDRFVGQEISNKVAELQAIVRSSNNSPKALNDLGVLYARYGLWDNAERQFEMILKSTDYLSAMVNLGNIKYLKSDFDTAAEYFGRAYKMDPNNTAILLGLARANQRAENYGAVKKYYGELKKADPSMAQQFAYLDLRGEEATRAAEISKADEVIVWSEQ